MKFSFLSKGIIITSLFLQGTIYQIDVKSIEGGSAISLAAFTGKKILITTISANNPDRTQLLFLDSLQRANDSMLVIAVPAADIGDGASAGNDSAILKLKTGMPLSFFITPIAMVTKASGKDQHPLFKWLTNAGENGHFDTDVNATGQLFVISNSGILYSVLAAGVPRKVLNDILERQVTQ